MAGDREAYEKRRSHEGALSLGEDVLLDEEAREAGTEAPEPARWPGKYTRVLADPEVRAGKRIPGRRQRQIQSTARPSDTPTIHTEGAALDPIAADAKLAVMMGDVMTLSRALALDLGGIEIHVDVPLEGTARGKQVERVVYLHPRIDPTTYDGRYLLAHELAHAAQRQLPSEVVELDSTLAEIEAESIGHAFARGAAFERPRVPLSDARPAFDDPSQEEKENKLLQSPPQFKRSGVTFFGITFTPASSFKWEPGMDKTLLGMAATVHNLVGPTAYKPALVREAISAFGGLSSIQSQSTLVGRAKQDDPPAHDFNLTNPLAYHLARWLMAPPRNLKITLTAAHLETLKAGIDAVETYPYIQKWLPAWYSQTIYMFIMGVAHNTLLKRYADAIAAKKTSPNDAATEQAYHDAEIAVIDALSPASSAVNSIRNDQKLVDHSAYRAIWGLPAKTEGEAPGQFKLDEASPVDTKNALMILADLESDPDLSLGKKAVLPGGHEARKQLLDNFAARAGLRKISLGGDAHVGDRMPKATMPPLPSKLTAYPALQEPFFDVPKGSDRHFKMSLWFPDVFEAWPGAYRYHFEVMKIPSSEVEKLQETADDLEKRGESPGMGDVLGSRLSRDAEYGKTDIKRSISALAFMLGPPGLGATTLTAVGAMLRMVGTVIRTFIEKLTTPEYEKAIPFGEEGLFVVRCISWPSAAANKETVITRAQSVAWLPLWVRPAEEMSKLRVNMDKKLRLGSLDRLREIEEELKKLDPQDKDYAKKKGDLEAEKKTIELSLWGSGEDMLDQELKALEAHKSKVKPGSFDARTIDKRIDEIGEIKKLRADRLKGAPPAGDKTMEPPFRLNASFVADAGQTVRLLMEAFQTGKSGTRYHYRVVDSTTKNSGYRDGSGDSREAAIFAAVRTILESGQGYGRGYVTVVVPASRHFGLGSDVQETLRIDADSGQVLMEAIENAALVASIAAVAAAPFTGGASLALLVPIGVVGAIPSAYRLLDRAQQGVLRLDMAAVMDIVNIVGAAVGLGQAAAAGRAAARGVQLGMGWMLLGLGNDGLSFAVMGAGFIHEIKEILDSDPSMPEGVKRARIMMAVGNQLLNLGIIVGAHLVAQAKPIVDAHAKGGKAPEIVHPRADSGLEAKFREAVGPAGKDIPVFHDKEGKQVKGNGVEIHYELDGYGLPRDLKVIMGPTAGAGELGVHATAAKAMMKYQGFLGFLRNLLDRANAWFHGKPEPPAGSRAWEAKFELAKLPLEIERIHQGLKENPPRFSPADAETYLKHLEEQVKRYEQQLNELEQGKGFIAAQAAAGVDAMSKGYPDPKSMGLKDHFYIEKGDGTYDLRRDVNSTEKPHKIVFEDGKPKIVPDAAPAKVDVPVQDPSKPPPPLAPPAATPTLDMARLRADLTTALKTGPYGVKIEANATFDHVSVRKVGGQYEVHFKPGTPESKIMAAVERHRQLAERRPADPRSNPYDINGRRWSGADEAAYQGRPDAEKGYHWALHDGELRYVRDEADGTVKKSYDEKSGTFVEDKKQPKVEEAFDKNTKPEQAFEALGGNDPNSEFGAFCEQVKKVLGIDMLAELKAKYPDPSELKHRTVRHAIKEPIVKRLAEHIASIPDKQQSHKMMLEVTEKMGSADRGSISERWYLAVHASKDAVWHASLNKEALANAKPPYDKIEISQDRSPDIVDKKVLKDVKDTRGPLGERDKLQATDFEKVVGKTIEVEGKPVKIEQMTTVFPEPAGARANAEYIATKLDKSPVNQTFEIFNSAGERKTVTKADLRKGAFNKEGGPEGLAKAIEAWAN